MQPDFEFELVKIDRLSVLPGIFILTASVNIS
jgi:hypothetical protein